MLFLASSSSGLDTAATRSGGAFRLMFLLTLVPGLFSRRPRNDEMKFMATRYAALHYLIRNVVYALASYPIGALSNRFPRTRYLAAGNAVAVATFIGFAIALPSIWWFVGCFVLAGVFIAWEDTIEGVAVREYVPTSIAGTAYGVLGTVNGVGDFASSLIVGALWTSFGAAWGFAYAVTVGAAGTILMALTKRP